MPPTPPGWRAAENRAGGAVDDGHLSGWAEFWNRWVGAQFLKSYLQETSDSRLVPASREELQLLLDTLLLERAVGELGHEIQHRPQWAEIPLLAIRQLLQPMTRAAPAEAEEKPMSLDPPRKQSRPPGAPADESALGAVPLGDGRCRFSVWAPLAETVHVHLLTPRERLSLLAPAADGYHGGIIEDVDPGALYLYRLDARLECPDPASRFQPQGVHGPSQVMDARFDWTDGAWRGLPLRRYIFYELHVGTFTPEGTFDGVADQLDELAALGITAVELMPVAQFPGHRNWGYDGVYPFAVQGSYGGPAG